MNLSMFHKAMVGNELKQTIAVALQRSQASFVLNHADALTAIPVRERRRRASEGAPRGAII
jgi:hypothetical protein